MFNAGLWWVLDAVNWSLGSSLSVTRKLKYSSSLKISALTGTQNTEVKSYLDVARIAGTWKFYSNQVTNIVYWYWVSWISQHPIARSHIVIFLKCWKTHLSCGYILWLLWRKWRNDDAIFSCICNCCNWHMIIVIVHDEGGFLSEYMANKIL